MTIDIHAHYLPESAVVASRAARSWFGMTFERGRDGVPVAVSNGMRFAFGSSVHFESMATRVALTRERGVDIEVLSLLPPLFRYDRSELDGVAAARDHNDELSELTQRFPGRLLGLATIPLQAPEAAAEEVARSLSLPGIVGVTIGTHVNGENLDSERLQPFFDALEASKAFVLIHPIAPRDRGALDNYYLRNVIGNPLETTIASACLMASGRLEALPNVTFCLAHGGGYTCAAVGRLDHAYAVRHEFESFRASAPRGLLRRFLFDTLVHDELFLKQLVDAVGADRVVLGTDFPADMGQANAVRTIRETALLTDAEKDSILHHNISALLNIEVRFS
jgi:aminocarboxymuconate-semialdehyde decarboxylase